MQRVIDVAATMAGMFFLAWILNIVHTQELKEANIESQRHGFLLGVWGVYQEINDTAQTQDREDRMVLLDGEDCVRMYNAAIEKYEERKKELDNQGE